MDLKNRCSAAGCDCAGFTGTKDRLRICDGCNHTWLTHLLEKLLRSEDPLSILDVCSLALYGTQAVPIRLKILIERLLSTLGSDEITKILRSFGWTPLDLARGYMIQNSDGLPLTRWSILPREEEPIILEQFHRFRSTQSLTLALLKKDAEIRDDEEDDGPEEMDMVLNLSSVGPPSSVSGSMDSSDDEEGSGVAVDLSSKSDRSRDSVRTSRPLGHQRHGPDTDDTDRKSSMSPPSIRGKPSWTFQSTPVVSTTTSGKKRVECSVCLKTFCDKGALKIHYSAVHLREMHQCTVSGCSMMFSSRRSRNRHSANPNPKLHSPHTRRKISPHDGRTAQSLVTFPAEISMVGFPPKFELEEGEILKRHSTSLSPPLPTATGSSPPGCDDVFKITNGTGARKRKLANPMRVSNSTTEDDHHDDHESRRREGGDGQRFNLPLSPSRSESNPSSPTEGSTPLQCLATKVFNFNNHFQNLYLNGLPDRWTESLLSSSTRARLEFLFDPKSHPVPPIFDENGQHASV